MERTRIKFFGGDYDGDSLDSADPHNRKFIEAILFITDGLIGKTCPVGYEITKRRTRRSKREFRPQTYMVTNRIEKENELRLRMDFVPEESK